MKLTFGIAVVLLLAPSRVLAWGALGHSTIGFVAMQFISPNTLQNVQGILGSEFGETLGGSAASWADTVRSQAAFTFSAPFHFIDAEDNPPTSCSVDFSRDCGASGCVGAVFIFAADLKHKFTLAKVSAIQNYTTRLLDTKPFSSSVRIIFFSLVFSAEDLSFRLDHFVGDIGQPLHDEALKLGGNDINAVCGGKSTNLHAAWDTGMLTTSANVRFGGSAQTYATFLANEIKTGSFASLAEGWLSCIATSALTGTSCPLTWAQEANTFNCIDVFNFTKGEDLCTGTYFNNAIPVIDEQLAKQGFRLAAWLDAVFDSRA
ncbi:nuclease Le1 [Vararia minispora EC-137]|uniref:Nuclease Le1 n=1 Tax=Vararia minispora EC-137 TaxID=1314806 RepID=A0ACB8QIK3_9AGAM|nr:nuclease Le1 [Vararia minispora EC-137]